MKRGSSVLSVVDARKIIKTIKRRKKPNRGMLKVMFEELSGKYKVGTEAISKIYYKKTWKDLW